METKVYSKNDIIQKLAQDGFFVDYLTLNSFLEKYKIEAIFEDDDGSEFFDKSAYDILVKNVLKRSPMSQQNNISSAENNFNVYSTPYEQQKNEESVHVQTQQSQISQFGEQSQNFTQDQGVSSAVESEMSEKKDDKKFSLENIKWYRWDDVSADLAADEKKDEPCEIIDSDKVLEQEQKPQTTYNQETYSESIMPKESAETQENYWGTDSNTAQVNESEQADSVEDKTGEIRNELDKVLSSTENEDDFDDIGLLSDSLQAQEKFQNYIVNELAKKNIDLTPPKPENAFKFDISEKTLNMIARAIAKKIAKQVSTVLSNDERNSTKLIQAQQKSQMLEEKVASLEEQNKKLKLLLVESNKNLNSYKPTFFGFYRFVRNKTKKRK